MFIKSERITNVMAALAEIEKTALETGGKIDEEITLGKDRSDVIVKVAFRFSPVVLSIWAGGEKTRAESINLKTGGSPLSPQGTEQTPPRSL
jgi:hypothetical protein